MRRFLLLAFAYIPVGYLAAEAPHEWMETAERIPYLNPSMFVQDRMPWDSDHMMTEEERAAVLKIWTWSADVPAQPLKERLKDAKPRIRTLAMCALWLKGNPKDLPLFHALVEDKAPTFPSVSFHARSNFPSLDKTPVQLREEVGYSQQSVGDFAETFVGTYMQASGVRDGFASYWDERKDLEHCLGWFVVKMRMGDQGLITPPLGQDRMARIQRLRSEIDTLNPADRAWTLLALTAPYMDSRQDAGPAALASIDDLVRAAQQIPRDSLLDFLLEDKIVSRDPDLRVGDHSPFHLRRTQVFLLVHADQLLRAEDADRLLAREQRIREKHEGKDPSFYVDASWAIGAANLQPDRADEILHGAFKRFSDGDKSRHQDQRCFLVQSMCRHLGEMVDEFVLDWFFTELPEPTAFGFGRHRFADWLGEEKQARVLKAIFSDPRGVDLDWTTFRDLGSAVNRAAGEPVISQELIWAADPKFDWRRPSEGKEARFNEHPAPKPEREAILQEWREAIQKTL